MRQPPITPDLLVELNEKLNAATLAVMAARDDPPALARAHAVRIRLWEALADLARQAGPGANAVKLAASLAAEYDGQAAQRASAKARRTRNPVDGILARQRRPAELPRLSASNSVANRELGPTSPIR